MFPALPFTGNQVFSVKLQHQTVEPCWFVFPVAVLLSVLGGGGGALGLS